MYECKQNGEDFFSSLAVTYSRFGNHSANGLVTEQSQYFVVICIFSTSQNTETSLIPNGLRLIFTCSLSLALLCIFHVARHTCVSKGTIKSLRSKLSQIDLRIPTNHPTQKHIQFLLRTFGRNFKKCT